MGLICQIFGHQWMGCRCARCGKQRNEGHQWVETEGSCEHTCAVCGLTETVPHTWNHCRCTRCGQQRDEHHHWLKKTTCEQVCRICGQERETHDWRHVDRGVDRCAICGLTHRLTPEEIAQLDEEWEEADVYAEVFEDDSEFPADPD